MKKNFIFAFIISLLILPSFVFAADTPAMGGILDRNVSRVSTYIGEGATSFQTLILRAADNWSNPGWASDVGFAYAPNNQGTMLDIYCYPKSEFGGSTKILGQTRWYDKEGNYLWPSSGTYRYSVIKCNTDALNTLSINRRTATFAHEMGHAFGLDHNDDNQNSIMFYNNYYQALTVQKVDTNTINRLY